MKRFITGRLAVFHRKFSNEVAHQTDEPTGNFKPFYFLANNNDIYVRKQLDKLIKKSVDENVMVSITDIFDILGFEGWELCGQNPNMTELSYNKDIFRVDYYFKQEI